jgi:Na+-transporting methylmalonyl-CoA/oxaloacetate decarboxylase gamma subunit
VIDWGLFAKIAGGGFGTTIVVLAILCIVVWVIGWALQRRAAGRGEEKK